MALNIEQIIADLKESTIIELADLVSAIEEEFGVSAAAPVAVAGAAGGEAEAEQTPFVSVAGRLVLFRPMGKNAFAQIQDKSGRIQIMFNRDITELSGYTPTEETSALKCIEKKRRPAAPASAACLLEKPGLHIRSIMLTKLTPESQR